MVSDEMFMLKKKIHFLHKLALNLVTCPSLASVGDVEGDEDAMAL